MKYMYHFIQQIYTFSSEGSVNKIFRKDYWDAVKIDECIVFIVFYSSSLFFYLHISQLNVHNILLNDITKTSHKHSSFYLTYLAKAS